MKREKEKKRGKKNLNREKINGTNKKKRGKKKSKEGGGGGEGGAIKGKN